jgi:hypothetical protein
MKALYCPHPEKVENCERKQCDPTKAPRGVDKLPRNNGGAIPPETRSRRSEKLQKNDKAQKI